MGYSKYDKSLAYIKYNLAKFDNDMLDQKSELGNALHETDKVYNLIFDNCPEDLRASLKALQSSENAAISKQTAASMEF